jgi:8-oxo-dGTP pyrophosphatase MutT (NUDIX family)
MDREDLLELVRKLSPLDERETVDIQDALAWIASGEPLYRIQKPNVPPKHLVSYFAVVDPKSKKMLLQDHLLAKLWLPPGGHVDPNEDPANAVRRECEEELGIAAQFLGDVKPHFITVTTTNGQGEHTDVSLWYVLQASDETPLTIEDDKFAEVRWWNIDDVLAAPINQFDPELHRFITKIKPLIEA